MIELHIQLICFIIRLGLIYCIILILLVGHDLNCMFMDFWQRVESIDFPKTFKSLKNVNLVYNIVFKDFV